MKKYYLYFIVLFFYGNVFCQVSVTFNVDMTDANDFNPENDNVYVTGSFAYWAQPGTDTSLMMMPTMENPLIYTLTFYSIPVGEILYKYFWIINNEPSWDHGELFGYTREVQFYSNIIFDDTWDVIILETEQLITDFESGNTGPLTLNVIGCGDWNDPELHQVDETFMIVDNPDPRGINISNKVMKFIRRGTNDGGLPEGGFKAACYPNFDLSQHKYVHIMVWKPKFSYLKFVIDDFIFHYEAYNTNPQTKINSWVDIVFNFSNALDQGYESVSFEPDFEDPLTSADIVEIYFDNIRINDDPEPQIGLLADFNANVTSLCLGGSVTFGLTASSLNVDSVLWEFPGGNPQSSTEMQPVIEYSNTGNFDVTMLAFGKNDSATIVKQNFIQVLTIPDTPNKPAGDSLICFNEVSSDFTAGSSSILWDLFPSVAGTINYFDSTCKVFWNESYSGQASIKIKAINICGESGFSETLIIEKTERPEIMFIGSPIFFTEKPYFVAFNNQTLNPELYDFIWYFGNGDSSNVAEPTYTYTSNGIYSVTLVATSKTTGCSDTFVKEGYIDCSGAGIGDAAQDGFRYFVDEDNQTLNLSFENQPENLQFKLFDLYGKVQSAATFSQKEYSVTLHRLAAGIYFFVLRKDGYFISRKIILTK